MIKLFIVVYSVAVASAANISIKPTEASANPQVTTTASVTPNAKVDTIFNEKLVEGIVIEEPKVEIKKYSRQSRQRVTSMNDALQCGLDFRCILDIIDVVMNERKLLILGK